MDNEEKRLREEHLRALENAQDFQSQEAVLFFGLLTVFSIFLGVLIWGVFL